MRHASASPASALLAILATAVAACGTREPAPTTDSAPTAPPSAAPTIADRDLRATPDPSSDDAGWPGRRGSILALVSTSGGVLEVELRADHDGLATREGPGAVGREVGTTARARLDSSLAFQPDADAAALLPGFRILDRIEWSAGRATRHLTVEGWRPGVEVAVRIPHELLVREARLLVHGAPFTVEPGTHAFDLPLSRDETTILEWTPREPAGTVR